MVYKRQRLFFMCMIFLLFFDKSLQKELGISQDSKEKSFGTSNVKWNSIFNLKPTEFSEDNHNMNVLNSLEKEPLKKSIKSNLMLSESQVKHLSDDEVFVQEVKDVRKSPADRNSKNDASDKYVNTKVSRNLNSIIAESNAVDLPSKPQEILPEDFNVENVKENIEPELKSESSESSLKFDNSLVSSSLQKDSLNSRSFIFNPSAKPQEHFQNCTTPKNESGSCRYLQHCLIPTIVSSLNQFMGYVCIIEERFIGVCCPHLPVSLVMIKNENDDNEDVTKAEENLNEECGVGTNRRIVGGSNADPKAWPWMVALLSKSRKQFFCGGVLINDRYVLTAAHCTFGVLNNEIIARLGEYDFKDDGESHVEYAVTEIKRHGHYNRRSLQNDIALLKLEKPVVFNDFIETICLPEEEMSYVGEQATLVGWGNIVGGGTTSEILQQASFPVISNGDCSKGHGLTIAPFLICTSSESGDKGACNGDSGGPLMLLDKNNRWKVIGLVSWGRRGCNPEFPTVYTRVSHYLEWIKKHST